MSASRYVLATSDDQLESHVRAALGSVNGELARVGPELAMLGPGQLLAALTDRPGGPPAVLAFGPDFDTSTALALARELDADRPDISVVLLAEPDADLLTAALRAGVRDVVAPGADTMQLGEAIRAAADVAERRRGATTLTDVASGPSAHVIAVVAPKGGSGKTTVSVNLAVSLALRHPGEVLLVDADLSFGDVAATLGLVTEHTTIDVAAVLPQGDAMAAKVLLTAHSSGLYVLAAPDEPTDGERVGAEQLGAMLDLLAAEFRYIVVDTAAGLTDHTLAVLDRTTEVLLVATMDVSSVRSLRKVVSAFNQLGLAGARHFVLNRAESRVGLDASDIAHTVGLDVDAAIPSSRSVPLSMNQGEPLVLADPKCPVSVEIERLADRFSPRASSARGGLLRLRRSA